MKDIFSYEVIEKGSNIYITFASSDEALERIRIKYLGKTGMISQTRRLYSHILKGMN